MSFWLLFRYKKLILLLIVFILLLVFVIRDTSVDYKVELNAAVRGSKPRLTIVVPFRDRFDELLIFVPYMNEFLLQQDIGSFRIFVINQSSKYRFNRGALINVGYLLAKNESDYIAMHDVDLIPINKNLTYAFPKAGPYHLSAPEYHPKYNYSKYFGGILLINNEQFETVNGMSNRYFGWGLEDDEFYTRIKAAHLTVTRPTDLTTDRNNTFLHFHYDRKRDSQKSKLQREALKYRDKVTGLKDIKYSITARHTLAIDGAHNCVIFNVELYCDIQKTPWCVRNTMRKDT